MNYLIFQNPDISLRNFSQNLPTLVLPELFEQADVKIELAVWLYRQHWLSMGKASELANIHRFAFQKLLASRQIPVAYDWEDFEKDFHTTL